MSRRALFGSMCSLVLLVNLARVVFAPLLEPLRAAFGIAGTTLGLVATLAWLGSAVPRLPTGYLLTRVARHRVVLGTGAVLTAAAAFMSTVDSVRALLAGAFLLGVASGAYFIAANPLISELYPRRVGWTLGIHGMSSQLAAVGAPVFVTAVLAAGDWRTAFRALAVGAAVATVGFWTAARRAEIPTAGAADRDLLAAVRHQWRIVLAGVAVLGLTGFVWNGLFNFYVTYLTAARGLAEPTARNLLTLAFGAGVPAFLLSGRLADRLPLVPYLLAVVAGFVGLVVAFTAASGVVELAAVSVALGYVVHSLFPAVDAYLLGSLPDQHRASAYAAYSASMMTVGATGSSAVGALVDAGLSFDAAFRLLVAGPAATVVVLAVVYRAGRFPTGARV